MKKAYPTYKETDLPWLKEVPNGWDVERAKYVFDYIDERSESGEETLLSVSEHHGVIPRAQAKVTMFKAESYVGYKLCSPGDLVINSLWAWSRGLGFSEHRGIISTAYDVFRLKSPEKFDYRYFNYLLRTNQYVGEYICRSKGIWISRLQLGTGAFREIPILLPSPEEQRQIAAYLDHKCALIDTFIAKKKRLIELLQEQKQAIINQAVTRGIDSDVALKPSGVDWLGDIPAHWEVKKLKYFSEIKGRIGFRGYTTDDLVPKGQGALT
ncbi:MAG: restriction endonuclease subunit S, partial [Bacteroidota bacterium]